VSLLGLQLKARKSVHYPDITLNARHQIFTVVFLKRMYVLEYGTVLLIE